MFDPIRYKKTSFIPKFAKQSRAIKRILKKDKEHVVNNTRERKELYQELKKYKDHGVTEKETRMALARLKYRKKAAKGRRHLSRKEITDLAEQMGVDHVDYKHFLRAKKFEEKQAAKNVSASKSVEAVESAAHSTSTHRYESKMPNLHTNATKQSSHRNRMQEMRMERAQSRNSRYRASTSRHEADRSRFMSKYASGNRGRGGSSSMNDAHGRANFGSRTAGNAHAAVSRMRLH